MVNRVLDAEVKAIKVVVPSTLDTTPWITAANSIVNSINSTCGTSFDETTLTQVELFLSAHLVGTINPSLISKKFENYEEKYAVGSQVLSGVMSDKYGQTANLLVNGCLAELDKAPASVDFL